MSALVEIIVVLIPLVLSLSVHEYAHALAAYKLGDDTASSQGRLTLDPIAHIDLIGTIVVPVISVLYGGFAFIGWAKPVPVTPSRFNRTITMRKGMIITALAGPGSNIALALVAGGVAMALYSDLIDIIVSVNIESDRFSAIFWQLGSDEFFAANSERLEELGFGGTHQAVMLLISRLFALNIGLAVFNMLPVFPLDGSRLLPEKFQLTMARHSMLSLIGLLIFINVGGGIIIWPPVMAIGNGILGLWSLIF